MSSASGRRANRSEGEYHISDELERPIWHRRVLLRPDVEGSRIWQVHGHASIDGINGGADLNVMRVLPLSEG